MRIAIVNDLVMAVEGLRRVIEAASGHEVAWVAYNGREALAACQRDLPDLVLMDLIMPEMDGVQATRRIMEDCPCPILVVTSTVTGHRGMVFEAMGAGALDAVNTPVLGAAGDDDGGGELLRKVATVEKLIDPKGVRVVDAATPVDRANGRDPPLLAIGASTGGPAALAKILSAFPGGFSGAIAVVQHVDRDFAAGLAQWLNKQASLPVRIANEGERLIPGTVLIAGTDNHLVLDPAHRLHYMREPVDYPYRPSVDVFFNSVAAHWRGRVAAVLLTGMGKDGAEGLLALRRAGHHTVAQDDASCVVYGMPKAAVELGAAVQILPLDRIGPALRQRFKILGRGGQKVQSS